MKCRIIFAVYQGVVLGVTSIDSKMANVENLYLEKGKYIFQN